MILAIDSSIGSAVAVVDPDTEEVLGQAQSETSRGHAEVIGTLILQALEQAGLTAADITVVAAGMGPGPFTGLRIGIAAARAFAIGRGIPVVPVASHDAAALEILERDPEARVVITTDARRRENAVSTYEGLSDGLPNRAEGPTLVPVERAETLTIERDSTENAESVRISPDPQNLSEPTPEPTPREQSEANAAAAPQASGLAGGSAERTRGTAGPGEHPRSGEPNAIPRSGQQTTTIPAAYLAIIAARQLKTNRVEHLDPLYLRAPDAKIPGAVKRVST